VRRRTVDPDPNPNPWEILEGRFFETREIQAGIGKEPETFSPSFRLLYRLFMEQTRRL
jgi:isopentenyl-diphosphate delta-isomerase